MNKEFDNNNRGSLWLSDYKTDKGEAIYKGDITINGVKYKLNMYVNDNSDNPRKPCFRLTVKTPDEVKPEDFELNKQTKTDVFKEFGDSVTITDQDIAF